MTVKFSKIPWDSLMLAGFAFAIPLMVLEFLRPGLITEYLPLQVFAVPFAFIIPSAMTGVADQVKEDEQARAEEIAEVRAIVEQEAAEILAAKQNETIEPIVPPEPPTV
jgi:hypothetical protein